MFTSRYLKNKFFLRKYWILWKDRWEKTSAFICFYPTFILLCNETFNSYFGSHWIDLILGLKTKVVEIHELTKAKLSFIHPCRVYYRKLSLGELCFLSQNTKITCPYATACIQEILHNEHYVSERTISLEILWSQNFQ